MLYILVLENVFFDILSIEYKMTVVVSFGHIAS